MRLSTLEHHAWSQENHHGATQSPRLCHCTSHLWLGLSLALMMGWGLSFASVTMLLLPGQEGFAAWRRVDGPLITQQVFFNVEDV